MSVKLGVAPIAWSNDDMPELGGETSLEQCLQENEDLRQTNSEIKLRMEKILAKNVQKKLYVKHTLKTTFQNSMRFGLDSQNHSSFKSDRVTNPLLKRSRFLPNARAISTIRQNHVLHVKVGNSHFALTFPTTLRHLSRSTLLIREMVHHHSGFIRVL